MHCTILRKHFNLLAETALQKLDKKLEKLISELPYAETVRHFVERFSHEKPRVFEKLRKQEGLFSDVLALSAWSPFLSTTLLQHTDYINWLGRERTNVRVKTREELLESLARFSLTNSQLDAHILLSRFRRRELLRIYLRDIRKTITLVETTEELSNLADAILQHALNVSQQKLDNLYGKPQKKDKRGKTTSVSFCIVALGKLGSLELNYASDIDLLFLYSDDGNTSGQGERGAVTNREYFVKLAESVIKLVGEPTGEGAAYRVDVRLRPHGRDGVLASSLSEAVRYYREKAQAWELQAMIRSRSTAGDAEIFQKFSQRIKERVYAPNVSINEALNHVRLSKQKIDRKHAHEREGYNVKLGRGGIREIEFIAQALQLAFGGLDEWLRVSHVLVSLGRLTERKLITERERMELFSAYDFLRTLEHRLQMEEGLQTHSVPDNIDRRLIVARRMSFISENGLEEFNGTLEKHTRNVRNSFERIFGKVDFNDSEAIKQKDFLQKNTPQLSSKERVSVETPTLIEPVEVLSSLTESAAKTFIKFIARQEKSFDEKTLILLLERYSKESLNQRRAIILTSRIASSLEKSEVRISLNKKHFASLVKLCGVSEYFGEMIAANPQLIASLPTIEYEKQEELNFQKELNEAISSVNGFRNEIGMFRRIWAKKIVEIGAKDIFGVIEMREANRYQTELAEASLEAARFIAKREMLRRYGKTKRDFSYFVFGLGRLGGRGMDYGSDLDVVLVYDDSSEPLYDQFTLQETYSRFTEIFVSALSSLTRDGYVYRIDLRLRPDGKNGANCTGVNTFLRYLMERAAAWEWLAYVKLRLANGDTVFGNQVESEARKIIHQTALKITDDSLRTETKRVRERLEFEKTKRKGRNTINIKYGSGGMLDVYFVTRYLQLRDNIMDEGDDRSTKKTLESLFKAGSLEEIDYQILNNGYGILRELDHNLRLIIGRSADLPSIDHPALEDIANRMGFESNTSFINKLQEIMKEIRKTYKKITV